LATFDDGEGRSRRRTTALALHTAEAQHPEATPANVSIHRADLQQHDLSIPGREVVQVRVDIDAGTVAPKHRHPGEEIIYVLEGSLEYQLEGQPARLLKTGDVLFIPAGAIHSVRNVSRENGAELATYIVEKGKPLIDLVK
jgi:quercetin dioxygenase-like cupin family protein